VIAGSNSPCQNLTLELSDEELNRLWKTLSELDERQKSILLNSLKGKNIVRFLIFKLTFLGGDWTYESILRSILLDNRKEGFKVISLSEKDGSINMNCTYREMLRNKISNFILQKN
jgi:hypothetical protein